MGTKLSTSSVTFPPSVNVRGEKGQYFKGELLGHKAVEGQFVDERTGKKKLANYYSFKVLDTDMAIQRKEGKEYVDVAVNVGDSVEIGAPTRLNNALSKASVGQIITIKYLGLGKATGKGGKPHEYEVEAEDAAN